MEGDKLAAESQTSRKKACDSCHKKKIQCDAGQPQCNYCKHRGIECTYDRDYGPRKKKRKVSSTQDVAERLERLERLLAQTRPTTDPTSTPEAPLARNGDDATRRVLPPSPPDTAASPAACSSFGKLHFAGHNLGQISSFGGVPLFSTDGQRWVKSRTGEEPTFCARDPPWQQPPVLGYGVAMSLELELPPRRLVDNILQLFKNNFLRLVFPVTDITLFREVIDKAYSNCPGSEGAKACVFAFLAMSSIIYPEMTGGQGDSWAAKAHHMVPLVCQQPSSLEGLETMVMLTMHYQFSGHLQSASMMISSSCRLLFMLGGHIHLPPPPPGPDATVTERTAWRVKSQLRKLFWMCFTLDSEISMRTGHPASIQESDCDLTLPDGWLDQMYSRLDKEKIQSLLDDDDATPLYPGDMRLTILRSRTTKLLYSSSAMRKTDVELLQDIRELDDQVERWRVDIPPRFRPVLIVDTDRDIDIERFDLGQDPCAMGIIFTHIEYYYLIATIHRASGRCRAWKDRDSLGNGTAVEMEGISSSLALSVEASRSTLLWLTAALHAVEGDAVWIVVFYPVTAILTLFCNILFDPLGPRSQDDLKLLNRSRDLIEELMRMRNVATGESAIMKTLDDFVVELARLAKCAVDKELAERSSSESERSRSLEG